MKIQQESTEIAIKIYVMKNKIFEAKIFAFDEINNTLETT